MLALAGFGAILAGTGIGWATDADASPDQDGQYLYAINQAGLTYQSADVAIAQGLAMCHDMELGYDAGQIVERSIRFYGLNFADSVALTAIAITVYCPWNAPTESGYVA